MPPVETCASGLAFGEARYPDNIIGHLRSLKMHSTVPYRSELARDYMLLCDYEIEVSEYRAFPLSLDFSHCGKQYQLIPDLMIVRAGVPTLVYCQTFENWQSAEEKIGLALATVWCMEHKCNLEIVTLSQVSDGHYLQNVKLLRKFARLHVPSKDIQTVTRHLKSAANPLTIEAMARKVAGPGEKHGISLVLCMAYHQLITLPLRTETISPSTQARLAEDTDQAFLSSA